MATGTATATGSAQRVIPLKTDGIYKALVIPQPVSVANFITVKVNATEYNLAKDFPFVVNKQHTFTVKVSKTSSGINGGIGNWETDEEDHGGEAV